MPVLNLTKYAEHRGCSYQAIQQSLAAGRIQLHHKEGRQSFVDVEESDRRWLQNTDSGRQRNPTRREQGKGPQTPSVRQGRQARERHAPQPPDYSDRSFEGLGCYLPAFTCEIEFRAIMERVHALPVTEQRGAALGALVSVCRGLGAIEPGPDITGQVPGLISALERLPEAQRAIGAIEIIERLTNRLGLVVDPAEQWQG